ncbi:MAG: histone deacetylase family protein, partial [Bryobacteraceae bacterium]
LLSDPLYKQHLTGDGHPERPDRYDAVMQGLDRAALVAQALAIKPRAATDDELAACHTRPYIATVRRDVARVERGVGDLSTGDTTISPRSLEVALAAAGGVLNAVDAVATGKAKRAFCAVRPPGHHATPDRGMGFCLFNNVAVAARYAQRKHGVGRVLIADWDVHHGNGTQDIFYNDGSVFFFSTHQSPWYPGTGHPGETGEGKGKGCILNCPFPAGSGRKEIAGAFRDRLAPAARRFRPELVIVSAGFDSRMGDPLGRFTLADAEFAELTAVLLEIGGGRLVSVLEGGYNLSGLASAATAHVRALAEA